MATANAILTSEFRVQNTINFYDGFYTSGSPNVLYLAFGRTTPWPTDPNGKIESDQGFLVPVPDAITSGNEFKLNFLGGVKLHPNNVAPVIPRVDFSPGTNYNKDDVVITDEYNVYLTTQSVRTNTKPTHTSGTVNGFYFLYKISNPTYIQNFVTADWIPVYKNGNVGTLGTPDQDSMLKAKCTTLMFSRTITDAEVLTTEVDDFRQIALWSNPLGANGTVFTNNKILPSNIDTTSGIVVYVDNRLPIYRTAGQTEEFKILIGF